MTAIPPLDTIVIIDASISRPVRFTRGDGFGTLSAFDECAMLVRALAMCGYLAAVLIDDGFRRDIFFGSK